jgi:hypothetical protein
MRQVRLLAGAAALGAGVLLLGAAAAQPATPAGWGTIKGQVVWGGDSAPERVKLKVDKDQDACLKKGDLLSDELVVDPKTKGVQWVFVWLVDAKNPKGKLPIHPSLKAIKEKEVVMDQPCCMFEPHAIGLRQGQVLVGKNSSTISHNMNVVGGAKNPNTNPIIPAGAQAKIPGWVAAPTPVSISCSIHPWMKGWVRVFDHPYFALTNAKGEFEIKDAPAGTWNLVVWQEKTGWGPGLKNGTPITIKAGETTTLDKIELKDAK